MADMYQGKESVHASEMAPALCTAIARVYHLSLEPVRQLSGGEECEIWLASSNDGPLVVRISPRWRSLTQLSFAHDLMLSTRSLLPVVIAPLKATDGSTFFLHNGHPVAIFPFVEGQFLDREDPDHRHAAAHLLAQLHRVMLAVSATRTLPRRHLREAPPGPGIEDLAPLRDPELDAWHASLLKQPATLTCGPIHGDYYRRNLLIRDGTITGVLDWDDAHPDFLLQEVAWSTWEFCQTTSGNDWHPERVRTFLRTYREAGGPCKAEEFTSLIPFVRWRLREEIRFNLAAAAAGENWDPEYVDEELDAFERFRGQMPSRSCDCARLLNTIPRP